MSKPEVSIIMPVHGEPRRFILDTVNSLKETIDIPDYEYIIVDDASREPLEPIDGVNIIRHKENKGVGQAFDTGVREARSDNLFLMGSDIRFIKNQWASKMIKETDAYPRSICCSTCVGINQESPENMDIEKRKNRSKRNGATIIMFHWHKTHPKKPKDFRSIIECQWLPVEKRPSGSKEVPSVLGAFYGIKKDWYEYIDGFALHRSWGTLEPLISLKSWFFGGSCRTSMDVITGHIFKRSGTHGTPLHHLTYNKLLAATLLFKDHDTERMINFLGRNPQVDAASKLFDEHKGAILTKKEEYRKKIVVDQAEWCKRWGIDFREND